MMQGGSGNNMTRQLPSWRDYYNLGRGGARDEKLQGGEGELSTTIYSMKRRGSVNISKKF